MIPRHLVESAQRVHDIVEANRLLRAGCPTKFRGGFDRACVLCPRREDGSLLIERQVGVINHVARVLEGTRRMQEAVEIEVDGHP